MAKPAATATDKAWTQADKLPQATAKDFIQGVKPQTGTHIVKTEDTDLVAKVRTLRYAEQLQGPKKGRQPASGRPVYILKLYPNRGAPEYVPPGSTGPKKPSVAKGQKLIPWFILAPLVEAGIAESKKQRTTIAKQLERNRRT